MFLDVLGLVCLLVFELLNVSFHTYLGFWHFHGGTAVVESKIVSRLFGKRVLGLFGGLMPWSYRDFRIENFGGWGRLIGISLHGLYDIGVAPFCSLD